MTTSLPPSERKSRTVAERDAEFLYLDEASPEERRVWNEFAPLDINMALVKLGYTRENADWSMVWRWCEERYRGIDAYKIEKGAKAYEDAVKNGHRAGLVQPKRSSARERLGELRLARSLSRSPGLRAA